MTRHSLQPLVFLGLVLPLGLAGAFAQTTPDAGALQQQIDRERQQQLPRQLSPSRPEAPPAMQPQAGVVITVREFRFSGNTLLTSDQLQLTVASYLNRPLDFSQLQAATAAVADAYRQAGWVVRAYLPEQKVQDGVVLIQIIEAVFGGVTRETREAQRVASSQILRVVEAHQKKDNLLNSNALDRALLLADDLPGVRVSGALKEGEISGQTNLALKLEDEPFLVGEATLDNMGTRAIGPNRLSVNAYLNSPLRLGDLLSANVAYSSGSDYARMAYTVPVGSVGWRVGANVSYLSYELIASEFKDLNATGTARVSGLEASYPVHRSRLSNLFLNLNYDWKDFYNQSSGSTISDYKVRALIATLTGNLFDQWGGGGANIVSLSAVNGSVNLDGSPNRDADAATTRTQGNFNKWRWLIARQQVVTNDFSLFAQASGQYSKRNLDSSEKFFLGGPSGVRAYPANEGSGATGQLLTLEARLKVMEGVTLTAFRDDGQIVINRNNNFPGAASLNSYRLQGQGLSLSWASSKGASLKATWARRDGDNPNPTPAGKDQDGSLVRDRFWLLAAARF